MGWEQSRSVLAAWVSPDWHPKLQAEQGAGVHFRKPQPFLALLLVAVKEQWWKVKRCIHAAALVRIGAASPLCPRNVAATPRALQSRWAQGLCCPPIHLMDMNTDTMVAEKKG